MGIDEVGRYQGGYPGCSQAGETVVMRGLLWYRGLMHKATQNAAAQFLLQPQYTDNP